MSNFGTLYRYEFKKLLSKKIVWISLSLCILIIIFSLFAPFLGDYYMDGKFIDTNYNMYQIDKHYVETLSGREINQKLLEETIAAYGKIPEVTGQHYTLTEEYQQYARPYSEIFNFIRQTSEMPTSEIILSWHPSEEDLYAKKQMWLMSLWEDLRLSKGEMEYWTEREAQIKTPYVYQKHDGYSTLISTYQIVGLLMLMLIAVCLSGIFSDEHTRKTDQLVLSCPLGKTWAYRAKIAVGISFSIISTILFSAVTFVLTICLYGWENFQTAFQLIHAESSAPITCGQAVLIAYGNMMFAAMITSVFVMVLSELLHSNIATLAISTGLLIMSMIIHVPEQYRVLAQTWNWSPWCFISRWNVFGQYTLSIFNHYFAPWQAVPMIYVLLSVMIVIIGKPIYQKFQVTGR